MEACFEFLGEMHEKDGRDDLGDDHHPRLYFRTWESVPQHERVIWSFQGYPHQRKKWSGAARNAQGAKLSYPRWFYSMVAAVISVVLSLVYWPFVTVDLVNAAPGTQTSFALPESASQLKFFSECVFHHEHSEHAALKGCLGCLEGE